MPFDSKTQELLEYQGRRLHRALHETLPPDRKEAEFIQHRVDDILDNRPRVVGVMPDGELVFDNQSAWEQAQVYDAGALLPKGETIAVNSTGQAEVVKPPDDESAAGGVGLLDRP